MTTTHTQLDWVAGDDCQINATLLDQYGEPFDLSVLHEIKWTLMDQAYRRIIDTPDVVVTITDAPAGKCSIIIPAPITSPLPAGRYTDVIRIVYGGITSTLSYGPIYVQADPWLAEVAVVSSANPPAPRLRIAASK